MGKMVKPDRWLSLHRRQVTSSLLTMLCLSSLSIAIYFGIRWELSKSDWAAWVQAVGSVVAIFVAVFVVHLQHLRAEQVRIESDRVARRGKLSTLRWIFVTVAEICSEISDKVHNEHVAWHLQAEALRERRKLLTALTVDDYPEAALLLRVQELAHRLLMAESVVRALRHPRKEEVRSTVAKILCATRDDALVGVTEVSGLLVKCSSSQELEADFSLLDSREEDRALMLKVFANR